MSRKRLSRMSKDNLIREVIALRRENWKLRVVFHDADCQAQHATKAKNNILIANEKLIAAMRRLRASKKGTGDETLLNTGLH